MEDKMSIINFVSGLLSKSVAPKVEAVAVPVAPIVEISKATYKGKWGYHPVSYETFLKLKELHKWYFITLRHLGTWVRWTRKTKYKVGPEPKYCHTFVIDKHEIRKHVNKQGNIEWRWYPKTRNDCGIREAYQEARMPKKTPEEVVELKISEKEINRLHSEVSKFFKV